jgi:hypothetical protein
MTTPSKRDSEHFSKRGPRKMPLSTPHNITNLCKIQPTTNSFFIEPHPTSASAHLLSTCFRFFVNHLHQAAAPDNFISGTSVSISPPSPNNQQNTL